MTDLFRRQALDHQRQKFHGVIVLTRHPARTAVAVGFLALVAAGVAFAATQGFTRKETVAGVLLPPAGVLQLVAPQAGVVQPGGPAQGEGVTVGEPVVRISSELSSGAGPTQALVARTLESRQLRLQDELQRQAQQARQQDGVLAARASSLEAALAEQSRQVALQRERVRVAQDISARYPDLVRTGAVSPVEASERENDLLDQQARLAALEQARLASQRELAAVRADRAALPLQAGREGSQLQREMQAVAQAQAEAESRREAVVVAPRAGRLAARLVPPGQAVAAGQVVATLLPGEGGALEAELAVPSRAAGFVRVGTPVRLRVDAFPYARFGQLEGHVREVSQSVVPANEGSPSAGGVGAPGAYRVRVALDTPPGTMSLRPGMRVEASLVGERRSLLAWAFEPLAALRVATSDRPVPSSSSLPADR